MRLSRIIVENYRSIRKIDVAPAAFSVFVGQNNHGKTNLFEAIQWFYTAKTSRPDEHFERNAANIISVTLYFEDVIAGDIEKLTTAASQTKIKNMLGEATGFAVSKTSADHKRRYIVGGVDHDNPTGLDTAINEFIPKLEYVSTNARLDDVAKYKDRNPIGLMLSGVLTTIIETSEEYKEFKDRFEKLFESNDSKVRQELDKLGGQVEVYLKKQFPDGTTVKFAVSPPEFNELLKSFETTVHDGIETRAEDKGDGMQRAIMLSIIQAFADYRRTESGGGTFLFLIDEAELHLHPSAQRALKRALLDICGTDQVLVNTHSSVLVVDSDDKQKIFKVEKEDHVTDIREVDALGKADVVFELLGGSPSDLLLPNNFLIVEGRSEFVFLQGVIRRFYPTLYGGLKVLFAGGDLDEQEGTLLGVHKLFSPLADAQNPLYRDRAIILIDKPNDEQQTKYEQFKAGYPYLFEHSQVFELPTNSLEEYYPAPHKKTPAEAMAMKTLKGEKVRYAKQVAAEITQAAFETGMPVMFEAVKKCHACAFGTA